MMTRTPDVTPLNIWQSNFSNNRERDCGTLGFIPKLTQVDSAFHHNLRINKTQLMATLTQQSCKLPLTPPSELPADIWRVILREATWVPHILDPDSAVEFCPPFSRARMQLFKTSLLTKRRVVRVCKQWNFLATPYLYESLIIKRSRTIMLLCEALQGLRRPANVDTDAEYPLGWWTKRFDIAMNDLGGDVYDELVHLAEIIRCLPNLNIITFRITAKRYQGINLPPYFLPNLSKSSGPNLQAISWFNAIAAPNHHDWYTFLRRGARSIRTAYCPAVSVSEDLPAMPEMRTFYISRSVNNRIQDSDDPIIMMFSLRHAIFPIHFFGPEIRNAAWKLVLRTCQNLEVIQIYFEGGTGISNTLETVSQSCPNLQRLDISVQSWSDLLGLSLPATIRVFGIHCSQVQAPRRVVKILFDVLTNKIKFGASLKAVQFLCRGTVIDLCKHHRYELIKGIRALEYRGLELQDHEGHVLIE